MTLVATGCASGYKPSGATCVAVVDSDAQEELANCYSYDENGCLLCDPGYDLVEYPYYYDDTEGDKTSHVLHGCVERADNLAGCNGVGQFQQCKMCDLRGGYRPKEVFLDQLPHVPQSVICSNFDDKETNLSTFT